MTRIFHHPWSWTTLAPLACAVHCVAAPLFVVVAPAAWHSPTLEWGFLIVTLLAAGVALPSGLRTHGDPWPVLPILVGSGLWAMSLRGVFLPVPEELTTTMAALTAAAGLVWNSRLHCAAREASCSACSADSRVPCGETPLAQEVRGSASR